MGEEEVRVIACCPHVHVVQAGRIGNLPSLVYTWPFEWGYVS